MPTIKSTLHDVRLVEATSGTTQLRGKTMTVLQGKLLPVYITAVEVLD